MSISFSLLSLAPAALEPRQLDSCLRSVTFGVPARLPSLPLLPPTRCRQAAPRRCASEAQRSVFGPARLECKQRVQYALWLNSVLSVFVCVGLLISPPWTCADDVIEVSQCYLLFIIGYPNNYLNRKCPVNASEKLKCIN